VIPYTLFYISTIFAVVIAIIALDFMQNRFTKPYFEDIRKKNSIFLYVYVFKVLAEVAVFWLIIAFIGQIMMGWISL